MRTILIITITVVFSLFLFVFLINYQYFYDEYNYVYAFKPKNAHSVNETAKETTTNISTEKQQQQSIEKNSLIDIKTILPQKDNTTYDFITKWGSEGTGDGEFNCSRIIEIGVSIYRFNWKDSLLYFGKYKIIFFNSFQKFICNYFVVIKTGICPIILKSF
jgi:hypothetical protein